MEMNELFYKDAYCSSFQSVVKDCVKVKNGFGIILEDTAFYPEGGGQPADHGFINDVEVFDVKRVDDVIYHYTKTAIETGSKVEGRIDFERRFDHMQQHSGEHIFSGLVHQNFGYENVGFHMGDDVITLDFSGPLNWQQVMEIENQANENIQKNYEIKEYFPTESELEKIEFRSKKALSGLVRIIEIPNADVCACCGTHVRFTGEVGLVKALSVANKKDGSRVVILCGKRALNYLQELYNQAKEISVSLAIKPLEIQKGFEQLSTQNQKMKSSLLNLQKSYLAQKLDEITEKKKLIIFFEKDMDTNLFRQFLDETVSQNKCEIAAGFNDNGSGYNFTIVSHEVKLRAYIKDINSQISGRGGGSEQMIQGSCTSNKEVIEKVLDSLFNC